MRILLLTILGLSAVMATNYDKCMNFLEEDSHEIGLYHEYYESGSGLRDKHFLFKHRSTDMLGMAIGLNDAKTDALIGLTEQSDQLNDVEDVQKFNLDVNKNIWKCSLKYKLIPIESDGRIHVSRIDCSSGTTYLKPAYNLIDKDDLIFHPNPFNPSLVIAMDKIINGFKRIEISKQINIEKIDCSDYPDICPHFLLNMQKKLRRNIQSIVHYKIHGMSGHLVLFNINETLMYCTQRYPSEQHSGMV